MKITFFFKFKNYTNYKDHKLDRNRGIKEGDLDEGEEFVVETQV